MNIVEQLGVLRGRFGIPTHVCVYIYNAYIQLDERYRRHRLIYSCNKAKSKQISKPNNKPACDIATISKLIYYYIE